ncbi:MAG: hypothetical protein V4649_11885 [Bacteroidota bacterium]
MQIFRDPAYKKVIIIGLAIQVIAAWFCTGYHYPDEQFQVYEFANYKLGKSPFSDLAWEYKAQIRSGIQPFIAYGLCKATLAIHAFNPFAITFIMRLLMGIFTWWVTVRLLQQLLPEFITERGKKLFVLSAMLLWFIPYIGVRFSAENFAGLLFLLSISLIVDAQKLVISKRVALHAIAGFLFGIALYVRLQMGFAFIGLGIWLLFLDKTKWFDYGGLIIAGIAAIGVSIAIDRWFYGIWVFTPYNYFYTQIVQNIAAKWGVEPWWYYFILVFNSAAPPISIALIVLFFFGLRHKTLHVLTLCCITFLVGHFIIGHKELRFLFPMTLPFIFLACIGADRLMHRYPNPRLYKVTFIILAVINCALLTFRSLTPAQEVVQYFKYVYNHADQPTTVVGLGRSPYDLDGLTSHFFRPPGLHIAVIQNIQAFDSVARSEPGRQIFFIDQYTQNSKSIPGYQLEPVYSIFPDFVLHNNFNNWQERSRIWAIYRVSPTTAMQQ